MSEIWTPGSPPSPSSAGGGIELPKGFSSSRRQQNQESKATPESTPLAETPPRSPTDEVDPAPSQPRDGQQDPRTLGREGNALLFPPTPVQVTCPSCSTPLTVPVFMIIDLGINPELRSMILSRQVNIAVCSSCGAGGPLSAPLMVHDPQHEFLGIVVPGPTSLDDMQLQKVIGEMSQTLMGRLPSEQRLGYMFQIQQFLDWESFLEKLWGFEGVTPEMLRRRQEQSELISSLIRLGSDENAMQMVLDRHKTLIDTDFFALLGQVISTMTAQDQTEQRQVLLNIRRTLLDTTEAGREVKALEERVQDALGKIKPNTTREEFLDLLLGYWLEGNEGETIATTILTAAVGLADYQFLMGLANRLERTDDLEERAALIALRDRVVEMNEQRSQIQQTAAQQTQAILQEVLQATDTDAALREHADDINEMFLAVLASNIEQAEKNKAKFAVERLHMVYEKALAIVEERLPADLKLLNQLLSAADEGALRRLLQEKRSLLSQEFVDALKSLEEQFNREGRASLASRIKSIRGQVTLML